MIDAATFICKPLRFQNICWVYPPKVQEVVSNPSFSAYLKILTISQEELEDEYKAKDKNIVLEPEMVSPFLFLLNCSYNSPEFKKKAVEAFQYFTHSEVVFFFEEKKILIGNLTQTIQQINNLDQLAFLTEENYFDFQNAIRTSFGLAEIKPPPPIDPNEDPRIRRMKEKMRERDRIKAKNAEKGKSAGGITLATSLAAICCMGIGLTPLNIGELSYAAVMPIMNMMQEKEKYDVDIRSLLAGADSKKIKPKYWIREND